MKKPTLEEVKKYFKNAEFVETTTFKEKRKVNLSSLTIDGQGDVWSIEKETDYMFFLWNNRDGFAKILTTKEPAYSITADQLMQLENGFTLPKLKEWFPEVFVKKLEVGKWYKAFFKDRSEKWGIINVTDFEPEKIIYYGFLLGIYSEKDWCHDQNVFEEATEQEVFEALKNEAVKRGFVEGNFFKCIVSGRLFECSKHELVDGSVNERIAFKNGIWAEVYQKL